MNDVIINIPTLPGQKLIMLKSGDTIKVTVEDNPPVPQDISPEPKPESKPKTRRVRE